MGNMIKKEKETLPCVLTAQEYDDRTQEQARSQRQLDGARATLKAVSAQYKADIEKHSADVSRLANIVTDRKEFREIPVEVEFDFAKGLVTTCRVDTGEIVRTRNIEQHERQAEIAPDDTAAYMAGAEPARAPIDGAELAAASNTFADVLADLTPQEISIIRECEGDAFAPGSSDKKAVKHLVQLGLVESTGNKNEYQLTVDKGVLAFAAICPEEAAFE